jgi:hypothetical protein
MNLSKSACLVTWFVKSGDGVDRWYTHFSARVSGAVSRWEGSDTGESLPSDETLGEATAVGEQMDHRGSLLWGRYEIDCCRFVAGRFGGNGVTDKGGTTSELEEVLDNESRLEVVRCKGRGGNECRLVGVVIFSGLSLEDTPATMNVGCRETTTRIWDLPTSDIDDVEWVTN